MQTLSSNFEQFMNLGKSNKRKFEYKGPFFPRLKWSLTERKKGWELCPAVGSQKTWERKNVKIYSTDANITLQNKW